MTWDTSSAATSARDPSTACSSWVEIPLLQVSFTEPTYTGNEEVFALFVLAKELFSVTLEDSSVPIPFFTLVQARTLGSYTDVISSDGSRLLEAIAVNISPRPESSDGSIMAYVYILTSSLSTSRAFEVVSSYTTSSEIRQGTSAE